MIKCPCNKCCLGKWLDVESAHGDILRHGFLPGGLVRDAFGINSLPLDNTQLGDATIEGDTKESIENGDHSDEGVSYKRLLEECDKELYAGCNMILELLRDAFLHLTALPSSAYEAKKFTKDLGLVIEFGDSYKVPTTTDPNNTATRKDDEQSGRTVTINEATKKRKNNLLKLQYGNFKAEGSETLEKTFNRLQVIVSQLQFMDVEVEKDDLNQKFLTSLAPEWLMHTIVWRNRNDLDTMSLDDLYNHLKVYEAEVQKKSNPTSQNMAFISSSKQSSRDEDGNTACVSTSSTTFPTASASVAIISQDIASAYIASQSNDKFWKKTGKKISIQGSDVAGFDKSKVKCFNYHKMGHFVRECRAPRSQERGRKDNYRQAKTEEKTPKALMTIDGAGWDWSYMANKGEDHALPFDRGDVSFGQGGCKITGKGTIKTDDANILLRTPRQHNMYSIDLNNIVPHKDLTCLVAKASADECILWHRRLGDLNVKTMNKLVRHNLVRGLPTKSFDNDHTCTACLKGKQHKASCKSKLVNFVSKPLHTLHMDLFGPTSVSSISHKWYCLVVTDDFSRFTWTWFLRTMDETSDILKNFTTEIENLKDLKVKIIRCDNGGEFRNKEMIDFCSQKGIKREFSNARTPQQNGVAKRRNRTLIEAARTMLADAKLPVTFWAEAVNTACYVQNRVLVNKSQNKTLYELFNGRTPAIKFLKPFGCHVMILNTVDNLGKFEAKGDEGYFIRYSMSSKAFRVFNKRTRRVEENLHVEFLKNKAIEKESRSQVPEGSGNPHPIAFAFNPLVDQMETLTVESPISTVSSPVPTACLNDSSEPSSEARLVSKRVANQKETPSLDNILSLTNRFDDILKVSTCSDEIIGVEADVSNMETSISASPTPTL
nr:putative ribonuclease H-like domain-containing protein [Tanacetum cinerariifolium]